MLPILFSDTGATSQDGSHSAIFRMQGPEGCEIGHDKTHQIYMGNQLNAKNRPSVFVLSVDRPLPPKQDLTNTLNISHRREAFQLWTLLKGVYPQSCATAAPENSRGWKAMRLSALWESICSKLSSQKTRYKSSQCDSQSFVFVSVGLVTSWAATSSV